MTAHTPTLLSQFFYQAMKPAGTKTMGFRAASDPVHLAEDLRRDGLLLLSSWKLPLAPSAAPKLSIRDEAALNEQLAVLLDRGVPLVEALEVAATVVTPRARERVERLRTLVAAGVAFGDACEQTGGFEPVTVAVYRAAERTGDLGSAGRRLAVAAKRQLAIKGKTITVMIYPVVVSSISILIVLGILMFLVPMFASQFKQMGVDDMNLLSRAVFALGVWLSANKALSFLLMGAIVAMLYFVRSRILLAGASLGRRIPAVGSLMLTVESARFFSVMGAMTKSGVPLAEALGSSVRVISNPTLKSQLERLRTRLIEGGVLRTLIEDVTSLPLATRRLLIAGERGGDLDSVFDALSEDLADDVDTRTSRLLALLEPVIIVLMFSMIGPLILAIAIPLMTFQGTE